MINSRFNAGDSAASSNSIFDVSFAEAMKFSANALDIYEGYNNYRAQQSNYKNKNIELELNRAMIEVQSLEDQNEIRREALRTMAAQNAIAGAMGIDSSFGTAAALTREVDYKSRRNIRKVKSNAVLRKARLGINNSKTPDISGGGFSWYK